MKPLRPQQGPRTQHGAALLLALLVMGVVTTLAASVVWQQWRAVQIEEAERARAQSAWILHGALDWARLILREDARTGATDHLGEPWAVPLAEARLSTFLAVDRDVADDAPEAFLSGGMLDAQSRFNLRNLVDNEGKLRADQLQVLRALCASSGVAPETAQKIATGLHSAWAAKPDASAALPPQTLSQLRWLGVDDDTLARLRPLITLLPKPTRLNLNTASAEVLAAAVPGLEMAGAQQLIRQRDRQAMLSVGDALALLPANPQRRAEDFAVASEFFEVSGRLRLGPRTVEETSLVRRNGMDVVVLRSERVNRVGL